MKSVAAQGQGLHCALCLAGSAKSPFFRCKGPLVHPSELNGEKSASGFGQRGACFGAPGGVTRTRAQGPHSPYGRTHTALRTEYGLPVFVNLLFQTLKYAVRPTCCTGYGLYPKDYHNYRRAPLLSSPSATRLAKSAEIYSPSLIRKIFMILVLILYTKSSTGQTIFVVAYRRCLVLRTIVVKA